VDPRRSSTPFATDPSHSRRRPWPRVFSSWSFCFPSAMGDIAQAFKDKEELTVGIPHYSPPHTRNLRRPSKRIS
jgi:hypothetical protein